MACAATERELLVGTGDSVELDEVLGRFGGDVCVGGAWDEGDVVGTLDIFERDDLVHGGFGEVDDDDALVGGQVAWAGAAVGGADEEATGGIDGEFVEASAGVDACEEAEVRRVEDVDLLIATRGIDHRGDLFG